jgi:hypothetical protein
MITIPLKVWAGFACFGFLVLGAGCRKSGPGPAGASNIQAAFKETPREVKEFADQAVVAEERNDFGTAFVHYRALSLNPDLTPEQRNMANDSMLAMNKKLREAATNGDPAAKSLLQMYRATK